MQAASQQRIATTGRWKLGFALALLTAIMWGVLPIALKALLASMSALTITWFRFLAAAIALGGYLVVRGRLWPLRERLAAHAGLLLVAAVSLCANYVIYLLGLDRVSPSTAQVVIQLAPMFLLLGGLAVFGERFSSLQWMGLVVLVGGQALFFNRRLGELLGGLSAHTAGVLLIVLSAVAWAVYGLAQKRLSRDLPANVILLVTYVFGALALLLPATPREVARADLSQALLLAFCAANTLIAYGAFAEALRHWEVSRVSAVLSTAPLITLAGVGLGASLVPSLVAPDRLNAASVAGALLVVSGSMLAALGGRS